MIGTMFSQGLLLAACSGEWNPEGHLWDFSKAKLQVKALSSTPLCLHGTQCKALLGRLALDSEMHGQFHTVRGNRSSPTAEDVTPQSTHHYLVSYKVISATVEPHIEKDRGII